ncbi:MAG TPA: hypothetical protein VH257_06175, partial [Chloroflexota bacterium]|nr:hypothetical protein [Chloroflexota bacterium]
MTRVARVAWVAWGLGAGAVVAAGGGLLLLALAPLEYWPAGLHRGLGPYVAFTLAFLPFAAIGAFLAARRPGHPTGWLFLAIGLLSGVSALANGWRTYGPAAGWALPGVVPWLAVGGRAVVLQCLAAVLLGFPDGRLPSPRWRPVAWLAAASLVVDLVASAVAPGRLFTVSFLAGPDGAPAGAPAGAGPAGGALGALGALSGCLAGPLEAAVAVATAGAVLWRLRLAQGRERRQLQWLTYAVVLATLAFAAHCVALAVVGEAALAPPVSPLLLTAVLIAGAPVAVAVAVARDGLYDIEWLINRTLVYVPLTAILAGLYAGAIT